MKYSSRILLMFFLLTVSSIFIVQGQGDNNSDPATQFCLSSVIPSPPGSASLGNYTTMPVNLYAGKPVIEIPIWDIKSRNLSVPLSLSYNSSGIKVQEISDWLGMGWALMGQGIITRTMRGRPDDQSSGYLYVGNQIPDDLNKLYDDESYTLDQCQSLADGRLDYEPDIFTFNFMGHSGDIVFEVDTTGKVKPYITPYQDLKISYTTGDNDIEGIHKWTIIDETGTTYIFGCEPPDTATETCQFDQGECGSPYGALYISSWVLKKIISPSKGDTIDFFYRNLVEPLDFVGVSNFQSIRMQVPICPGLEDDIFPPSEYQACPNSMDLSAHKLKSIRTATTIVDFVEDSTIAITGGVKLDSILIKDRSTNKVIRTFAFYYTTTDSPPLTTLWGGGPETRYRLWLDSLAEENSGVRKTYKMFYNNRNSLPARNSWTIDHWGYFNSNNGVLQGYHTLVPLTNISGTIYGGADRTCDTSKVTIGMIDSIVYPTGGSSRFYYESNDFFHTQSGTVTTLKLMNLWTEAKHKCDDPEDDTLYSDFYIDHDQYIDLSWQGYKCGGGQDNFYGIVGIRHSGGLTIRSWGGGSLPPDSTHLWLAVGEYSLFAVTDETQQFAEIFAYWQSCDTTTYQDTLYYQYGGGVRIKRIVDYDGRQSSTRHFIYRLSSDKSKSSGNLMGTLPAYTFSSIRNYGYTIPFTDVLLTCSCTYLTITANTTRQQETTQGNYVGYSEVTELLGENGENGKIIHNYYVPHDIGGDYFPFPPKTSNEWKRGMEQATKTYDKNGHPRKEEDNLYYTTDNNSPFNFHSIGAVKVGWRSKWCGMGVQPLDWLFEFSFAPYEIYCGWKYQYKKITITYDTLGLNPVYDSTKFIYEHPNYNLQITKTSHINSDGIEKIQRFRYPEDYSGIGSDTYGYAISMMRDSLHMIKSVIEYLESERKTTDTTELITGGNIFLYSKYSTNNYLAINPYKSIGLETITPISLSSFTKSKINNGNFVYDSHFLTNKVTYDLFDKYGNLLHFFKTDNIPISFNWGYNNALLITNAVNSSYDPTNTYSNSSTQVTRYVYDHPLIGISKIIDPIGHSTYYYYDPLGRLNLIRNDDQNILQKIDYHYKTH